MRCLNRHTASIDETLPGTVGEFDSSSKAVQKFLRVGWLVALDGDGQDGAPSIADIRALVARLADRDGLVAKLEADNKALRLRDASIEKRIAELNDKHAAADASAAMVATLNVEIERLTAENADLTKTLAAATAPAGDAKDTKDSPARARVQRTA